MHAEGLADLAVLVDVPLVLDGWEGLLEVLVVLDDVELDQGVGGEVPELD